MPRRVKQKVGDVGEKLDRILIGVGELKTKISKIGDNIKTFDSRLTAVAKNAENQRN